MGILRKLWWGQYSLGVAFWGFYVGGLILSVAIFYIVIQHGLGPTASAGVIVVSLAYRFIASVGVWNSAAPRLKSAIWMDRMPGYLARFVVFIYAAKIIWGLMNGDALNLMNLITQ
jgi:hypothetical protein